MQFERETSRDILKQILDSGRPAVYGWPQVVSFHESLKEKDYWKELKFLDVEGEQKEIGEWLKTLHLENEGLWVSINRDLISINNKNFVSRILIQLDEKIKRDEDYPFLNWILPIAYSALVINELVGNPGVSIFLNSQDDVFVIKKKQ